MAKERMENDKGVEGEEVAETKALYTVFRTRTKSSSKGKTIRKEKKIVEHAIFHLVTRPDPLHRIFSDVSFRCRSTTGRDEGKVVQMHRLQTRVAKDIIAGRERERVGHSSLGDKRGENRSRICVRSQIFCQLKEQRDPVIPSLL